MDDNDNGCRPALNLNLSSNLYTSAGTVCSDGTKNEVAPQESGESSSSESTTEEKSTTEETTATQGEDHTTESEAATTDKVTLTSVKYKYGNWDVDVIKNAHTIETNHKAFDLICSATAPGKDSITYILYSGSTKIAESTFGSFYNVDTSKLNKDETLYVEAKAGNKTSGKVSLLLKLKDRNIPLVDKVEFGGTTGLKITLDEDIPILGGSDLKLKFPSVPISAVVEDGVVKVGINYKKEALYDSNAAQFTGSNSSKTIKEQFEGCLNDIRNAKGTIANYKSLKNCLATTDCAGFMPGFSDKVQMSIMGYCEGTYSDSLESLKGTIILSISASHDSSHTAYLSIPVTFNIGTSLSANVTGSVKIEPNNNKVKYDITTGFGASLTVYGGVGVGTWVSAGVYGTAATNFNFNIYSLDSSPGSTESDGIKAKEITLSGEAGVKGYFAGCEILKYPLISMDDLKSNDRFKNYIRDDKLYIYSDTGSSIKGNVDTLSVEDADSDLSKGINADTELECLETSESTVSASAVNDILVDGVMAGSSPQIINNGDVTLLAYVDSDSSRNKPNQAVVKYMIYDEDSKTFTDPQIVLDDGTADTNPQFFSDGEDIYIYYLDSAKVFDSADIETSEFASAFAVTVAKYNTSEKTFQKMGTLTNGNHYCYLPAMKKTSEGITLVWGENASDSIFTLTSDNNICKAVLNGDSFGNISCMAEGLNAVTGIAMSEDGKIAFLEDMDNNLSTTEQQIFEVNTSGTITEGVKGEFTQLQYEKLPGKDNASWVVNQSGDLAVFSDVTQSPESFLGSAFMGLDSAYKVNNNRIYFIKSENGSRNIGCLIKTSDGWQNVSLTNESDYVDQFTSDGSYVTYTLAKVDVTDANNINPDYQIKFLKSLDSVDIALEDIDYDGRDAKSGETLPVTLYVKNNGTQEITSLQIEVSSGSTTVMNTTKDVNILPGEDEETDFDFTVPSGNPGKYTVKVSAAGQTDADDSDNSQEIDLSKADLSVEGFYVVEEDGKSVEAVISNNGSIAANATIVISDSDGNEIYTSTDEILAEGEKQYKVDVKDLIPTDDTEKMINITVTSDQDEYYTSNNTTDVLIYNQAPSESVDSGNESVDPTPVTPTPVANVILAGNITKTYSAKAQSFSIGAQSSAGTALTYASDNNNIAVNGSTGMVTVKAKYIGSATITISSAGTDSVQAATTTITVTVNPSKTKLSSAANVKGKKIQVKWKKNTIGNGYQIQCSTSKEFASGNKTVTVKKNKKVTATISKLKKGKTYYVRVRTYKTVAGKNYFSEWSNVKKVKIKK